LEANHFLAETYTTVSIFIKKLDTVALLVLVLNRLLQILRRVLHIYIESFELANDVNNFLSLFYKVRKVYINELGIYLFDNVRGNESH